MQGLPGLDRYITGNYGEDSYFYEPDERDLMEDEDAEYSAD